MGDEAFRIDFGTLHRADLTLDGYYHGGRGGHHGDDPIAQLIPRAGNQGGFRPVRSIRSGPVRMVALCSSGKDPDWPDALDEQTGLFTYYGDNKRPGTELHNTPRKGNLLLRDVYAKCYGTADDRRQIPPFFLFTAIGTWRDVRFRGLLVPGAASSNPDDDLQAIWRTKDGLRFQNYRSRFTVLDVPTVTRAWIDELFAGEPEGPYCPSSWREWIEGRVYRPLLARRTTVIRTREEQTPAEGEGQAILTAIRSWFADDPHRFEQCAVELWRMMAPATGRTELTPRSRDGGRDAVGEYVLGPAADRIGLDFAMEAKCYGPRNSVGVREVSRLISRIRHRMFGVFVTTSYVDRQAYGEVRDDGHPIVLICGRDIVDILRSHGYASVAEVERWLASRFSMPAAAR
ncbi:MAG: restriction endonuclease [Dactylosporangium sp.]|nr:restriction endonuclease [Dactylosporangium sp.]NNJ60922.1 restriction endonuclease [Dactylosporangium sp.]